MFNTTTLTPIQIEELRKRQKKMFPLLNNPNNEPNETPLSPNKYFSLVENELIFTDDGTQKILKRSLLIGKMEI